jgi:hypothetical protein
MVRLIAIASFGAAEIVDAEKSSNCDTEMIGGRARWVDDHSRLKEGDQAAASTAFLTDCGNAMERKNIFG